jgi:hypothetical protein
MNVLPRCEEESDTNECLFSEYGYNLFAVGGGRGVYLCMFW